MKNRAIPAVGIVIGRKMMGIRDLPENRRLINLVEECGELAQAAAKYIRTQYFDTDVTPKEAKEHLIEEMADVSLCIEMATTAADRVRIRAIRQRKKKRWEDRIEQETEIHGSV